VALGTLLGLGIGCGLQDPRLGRGPDLSGGFQWAAADTSRVRRTAHYFKQIGQPELGAKELEEAHRLDPGNLEVAAALAQYYDELGMGAPPPRSPLGQTATPARGVSPTPQPVQARQPDSQIAAAKTSVEKPRAKPRGLITARELTDNTIAILNGNGIHNLAPDTRSRLSPEGHNAVAINNFRDFGVGKAVICYRPDSEHVATILNQQFFPGA
jgi:hypothetical protein